MAAAQNASLPAACCRVSDSRWRAVQTTCTADVCRYDGIGSIRKRQVHKFLQQQRPQLEVNVVLDIGSALGQLIEGPPLFKSLKHRVAAADCNPMWSLQCS